MVLPFFKGRTPYFAARIKSMPFKPDILPIIKLAASASAQQYSDQQMALKVIIPRYLREIINLTENAVFSKPVALTVSRCIIQNHRELLSRIDLLNEQSDSSCTAEIINRFKHDVEMTRLFFEGINLYFDEVYSTFFSRA